MLDAVTRRRIDTARDILVGKVPDPKSQVEQITIALIYKFMDDIDAQSEELGGRRKFFAGDFARYGWAKLMRSGLGGYEMLNLYADAITRMPENPGIPPLFRDIFNNAYLPYRDPETLRMFLKVIDEFSYDHSERLGDAFEYLLSVLGSQGDAGQFRTPRHIIDFIVEIIDPKKDESVLDPACGTAGFLISSYKHIMDANTDKSGQVTLTPDERTRLANNFNGYDISPDMVRLSLVNMYLHGFPQPNIYEYDTLTSDERWNEYADVILANPPFMNPKGGIRPHNLFSIKARRSEVLFVDYIVEHLTLVGRAGVIVPEGIIFQSQNAHKQLRRMLVDDYLVAVISLPAGVFKPYSGVKTSILIMDKSLAKKSDSIAFFKVENDGYDLGDQRRPIADNDLPQAQDEIVEYLRRVRTDEPLDGFEPTLGQAVPKEKIAANGDYGLSGERYVKNEVRQSAWPLVKLKDICEAILTRIHRRGGVAAVEWTMSGKGSDGSGRISGRWVQWRPSAAAWRPCGSLRTLAGRDGGERTQQETLADRGGASLRAHWVRWSGWEWNSSQSSQGATELGFPGPVLGKMQSEATRLAGEPSGEGEEAPPEGLGGNHLLAQTDAHGPAGQVMGHHLCRQPGGVGGEAPRGEMVEADAVLEVSYGVLDLGVAAMVGLQFQGLTVAVGDEAVIAVAGEERQLGTGRGPDPADDETHRFGVGLTTKGYVGGLSHVGCAVHPVGYGSPVLLRYGLYEIAQSGVLTDGDGEADTCLSAYGDDVMGVEATVGAYGELSCGPGAAHPAHRLTQEVGCAPGGIGAARSQPGHQHVAGSCGDGHKRVIASLAGVVVAAGALLAQSVGLADGGVQVDGQRLIAGTRASGPGPRQQLPAHPIQLAHVPPPEAAQEGPQGGWRLHRTAQHPPGPAGTQRVGIVDAVPTGQRRGNQGQHLVCRVRASRRISQVKVTVHQFTQTKAPRKGERQR